MMASSKNKFLRWNSTWWVTYLALGFNSISVAVVAEVRVEEVDEEISSSDVTDVAVDVMHDDMPKPLVIVDEDEPEIEIITN